MTEDMLLVLAMSTDAFFAALSYGAGKIKIPFVSAVIMCTVSTAVLTCSVCLSGVIGSFIPDNICRTAGALLLGIIGITGFCQNGLKTILRKHQGKGKLSFCWFNIDFVISVYLDETQADSDMSKVLSPKESLALAAALSVDSVSGGLGAGLSGTHVLRVSILSFIFGLMAVGAGGKLGEGLKKSNRDFSWVSGIFLIILAVYKLFS
ncbi:hypothetical protein [Porcipelethomonas sp.]|uniref:hypothetical protein n=1 Tax=Porcipelethomonas sp. TaxID=2981675 RepID=UPI003EFB1963